MKYEVGDTVLLLHSGEEGNIVEIMNETMVMVNVQGVEFPVFTDQIDFPYFKRFSEQSKQAREKKREEKIYIDQVPKEKNPPRNQAELGVHFSFVPVYDSSLHDDTIEYFKLFLLNQNNEAYHFEYNVIYKDDQDFSVANILHEQSDFYLHNISQEELNDIIRFQFLFSLVRPAKQKVEYLEKTIRIKAKGLFKKIEQMHIDNVPSFSFELFNQYPDKPAEEYFPLPEKKPAIIKNRQSSEAARSVVDLHIEKIENNYRGLSNFEIIQIQLTEFEKYYLLAVNNMQPKLIVIHGVGSGRLRNEIHERLRMKPEVKSFVNQYHPSFGFGATEIYFQY